MSEDLNVLDQHLMLAILRLRPGAYGVAIQKWIEERTGRKYSVGAIYAGLDRLEEKGYARSKPGESTPERGGRAKLYFNVTAPGVYALRQSLQSLDAMRKGISGKEVLA